MSLWNFFVAEIIVFWCLSFWNRFCGIILNSFRLAGRLRPAMPALKQGTRKNLSPRRRTKTHPLIVGAPFSFWSFFIDFELMSNFFVAQEKGLHKLFAFQNDHQRLSNIIFWVLYIAKTDQKWKSIWCWHTIFWSLGFDLCAQKILSFFTSIGTRSRTSQF